MTIEPAIHPDLRVLALGAKVLSARSYELDGAIRQLTPDSSPDAVIEDLVGRLYSLRYTLAGSRRARGWRSGERRAHLERLSMANTGRGTWEPDWQIVRQEKDGRVVVRAGGLELWARRHELKTQTGEIAPLLCCRVRVGKEVPDFQAGYYLAIGDAEEETNEGPGFLRFYWHVVLDGAVPLLRALTETLNRGDVPFRFKILSQPRAYRRADAGVLYVRQGQYPVLRPLVQDVHRAVSAWLRPEVPMMTRRLALGLGLAEDVPGGNSFGESRCELIARALWNAFETGANTPGDRLAAIAATFRQAGLDPLAPHLGEGGEDVYEPLAEFAPLSTRSTVRPARRDLGDRLQPLDEAIAIGRTLLEAAYWSGPGCGWMAPTLRGSHASAGRFERILKALGGDLYSGTAGVALFLGELFARTGESDVRRGAQGALTQAFGCLERQPETLPALSFYTGQLGLAWVARRVGRLIGRSEWIERGDVLQSRCLDRPQEGQKLDLLTGNAGAILALLAHFRATGETRSLDVASSLGDEILQAADRAGHTWSWSNDRVMGSNGSVPPLTGLSHGAAGIGLALLELAATSGRRRYREAACGAFDYEDGLFDSARSNWPDFRVDSDRGEPGYPVAWCHGAAGIALSRLRMMELGEADACRSEAAGAGVSATLERLRRLANGQRAEPCLCHGWSGLADIALSAAITLGEPDHRQVALDACINQLARQKQATDRELEPSLMLGQAGVGYTLLRLCDAEATPSVLLAGI